MGVWPTFSVGLLWFVATGMLLLWYASLQLLASMMARDFGSSVTIGVAMWMFFTLIWLLVTVVLATMLGVEATDTTDPIYRSFAAKIDLFSPNGVYQLLLQTALGPSQQPLVAKGWIIVAAGLWTVLPTGFYLYRFKQITP
jgi:ABC-type transport system involved in multi-copper enzyme maturation permease subunit